MLYLKRLLLALAAVTLITGCGGSSDGPGKATITAANAKDLAVAATEATKSSSSTSDFSPYKSRATLSFDTQSFTKRIAQELLATENITNDICDIAPNSGTVIITYPDDPNATSGTVSFNFTDCTITETYGQDTLVVVINGSVIATFTSSSATISANLTITENGVPDTISFNGKCRVNGSEIGECTFTSTFTGIDGRRYTTVNMSVTGDEFSGYTVTGSVTDPDHGVITITTPNPVHFDCIDGNPSTGSIVVTGANGTAAVTYNSCSEYTVTFEGVSNTYQWADI